MSAAELARGRAAYQRRAWAEAYDAFTRADSAGSLAADDLWRLAMTAHLVGRDDEFLQVLERAHQVHLGAGDAVQAARCAFWLGFRLATRGEMGRGTG